MCQKVITLSSFTTLLAKMLLNDQNLLHNWSKHYTVTLYYIIGQKVITLSNFTDILVKTLLHYRG